jgi:hypothetical protein
MSATPWFTWPDVPTRSGVYEVRRPGIQQQPAWWAKWDGERWRCVCETRAAAAKERSYSTDMVGYRYHAPLSWRGLREPAK